MKKIWLIIFCFPFISLFADYDFAGRHYLASFYECDHEALTDLVRLRQAMQESIELSGATILSSSDYLFPPNGLTMVWLLSESHASIHTYPEHGACFVDLFTCGERCSYEKFEAHIKAYLQPMSTKSLVMTRE